MGLRRKKKKSKGVSDYKLPELPELPEFPSVESPPGSDYSVENGGKESLPQLPSFPNNNVGDKFSQNSIKEAVSGQKEVREEEEDDFSLPGLPEAPQTIPEPLTHEPMLKPMITRESYETNAEPRVKEFHREVQGLSARKTMESMMEPEPKPFTSERKEIAHNAASRVRSGASSRNDPVFIRIDKFEESLKVFEKTREQIDELEGLVKHVKDLKVKEEEELIKWEEEIQLIKEQIGKVDRDIFSKVE